MIQPVRECTRLLNFGEKVCLPGPDILDLEDNICLAAFAVDRVVNDLDVGFNGHGRSHLQGVGQFGAVFIVVGIGKRSNLG